MYLCSHRSITGGEVHLLYPICKIKKADLKELPLTRGLVYGLNLKSISYFEQLDAFCYHNTQFCMTSLYGKTLGVQIIVAPTVYFNSQLRKAFQMTISTCGISAPHLINVVPNSLPSIFLHFKILQILILFLT